MKKLETVLLLTIGISLTLNISGYAQKKPNNALLIRALPNAITVRNFSIAIYNIERYENLTIVKFVARKISFSTQKFPFNFISVIDDHGNKYSEQSANGVFSNAFEDLIIAAPLGLTWYFDVYVFNVPQAAPIAKVELVLGIMTVVKTIDLTRFPLRKFNPTQEINAVQLRNANIISIGNWSKKGKYLEWSVGKIKQLDFQTNIEKISVDKFWLIPIIVRNSDYNGSPFSLAFFFQLNDGTIIPFRAFNAYDGESHIAGRFCESGEVNCMDWSYNVSAEIDKDLSPQTTEHLNYYYFPISVNRNPRIPNRMFIMSFDKTWFYDTRANCKLFVLEINSTIFEHTELRQ